MTHGREVRVAFEPADIACKNVDACMLAHREWSVERAQCVTMLARREQY